MQFQRIGILKYFPALKKIQSHIFTEFAFDFKITKILLFALTPNPDKLETLNSKF
jgi:hypothetical protein